MAEEAPPPAEETAEGGKKKKSKLLIIIAAVVVLALAGAAVWYFLMHKKAKDGEPEHVEEKVVPPLFVTLDSFTVNLAAESSDRYLQVGMDLKISSAEVGEKIKLHLPEIRNGIVLLLTSKTVDELASLDGKNRLREDIRDIVNKPIGFLKEPGEKKGEAKGAEEKPAEGKPAEGKPAEEKAQEAKPAESNTEDKSAAGSDHLSEPPPAEAAAGVAEKPKSRPAPKEGVLDVLLTSFVIQ